MNGLIPTLFLIAAICLLPSWLAGCLALGGAFGLLVAGRVASARSRKKDVPPVPLPENVVRLKRNQR